MHPCKLGNVTLYSLRGCVCFCAEAFAPLRLRSGLE